MPNWNGLEYADCTPLKYPLTEWKYLLEFHLWVNLICSQIIFNQIGILDIVTVSQKLKKLTKNINKCTMNVIIDIK